MTQERKPKSAADDILDVIDAGLQSSPEAAGSMPVAEDGICVRCKSGDLAGESDICNACRSFLLGDTEIDPAAEADWDEDCGCPPGTHDDDIIPSVSFPQWLEMVAGEWFRAVEDEPSDAERLHRIGLLAPGEGVRRREVIVTPDNPAGYPIPPGTTFRFNVGDFQHVRLEDLQRALDEASGTPAHIGEAARQDAREITAEIQNRFYNRLYRNIIG